MDIKKIFFKQVLDETLKLYSEKVTPVNNVELKFVSKEIFLESAKKDKLIQFQIQLGVYKDFEKEYPNFLVVYNIDKNPLFSLLGGNYKISICDEIAKDKLKSFTKQEVRDYLMHGFSHEITHILEDDLKVKLPDLWQNALDQTNGDIGLAHEQFAEDVADIVSSVENYKKVEDRLFSQVNQNLKRIRKIHGLNKTN
jgi:hypothetical protein